MIMIVERFAIENGHESIMCRKYEMVLSNNYVSLLYKKTHNVTATVVFIYVCMYN